jgi:hypothetical protein
VGKGMMAYSNVTTMVADDDGIFQCKNIEVDHSMIDYYNFQTHIKHLL